MLGELVAGDQGYTDLKKKLVKSALRPLLFFVLGLTLLFAGQSQARAQKVKQPEDVIEAYQVVNRFQQLMAADLDFDRAFEATFTKDPARRRAIALAEGEFGDLDLASVDDATLVTVYKNQTQLLFLTLLLIDENKREASLPKRIKDIYDRGKAHTIEEFRLYVDLLKQDIAELRNYLTNDPAAAQRLRNFKSMLTKPIEAPRNYVVRPITFHSKGRVLDPNAEYYQIGDYAVIREGSEMRIIGIRFFSRLF